MIGWSLAAYFAGLALTVLAFSEDRWRASEVAALLAYPVIVPVGFALKAWRRWRYTCRDCGRWYGDKQGLARHRKLRVGCTVAPEVAAR